MRINVYSQELTDEVKTVTKRSNTGEVFTAAQLILLSTAALHHNEQDDDRSAVMFWLPKSRGRKLRMARAFMEIAQIFQESEAGPQIIIGEGEDLHVWEKSAAQDDLIVHTNEGRLVATVFKNADDVWTVRSIIPANGEAVTRLPARLAHEADQAYRFFLRQEERPPNQPVHLPTKSLEVVFYTLIDGVEYAWTPRAKKGDLILQEKDRGWRCRSLVRRDTDSSRWMICSATSKAGEFNLASEIPLFSRATQHADKAYAYFWPEESLKTEQTLEEASKQPGGRPLTDNEQAEELRGREDAVKMFAELRDVSELRAREIMQNVFVPVDQVRVIDFPAADMSVFTKKENEVP